MYFAAYPGTSTTNNNWKKHHQGPVPLAWREWNGAPMSRPTDPVYAIDPSLYGASSASFVPKNSKLYCGKCKMYRPYRTGHCKRCNICVTRIDHHCQILNNCVCMYYVLIY